MSEENVSNEFPKEWSEAHSLWETLKDLLPEEMPKEFREEIESNFHSFCHRVFGQENFKFEGSIKCPPEIAHYIEAVEKASKIRFERILLEIVLVWIEISRFKVILNKNSGEE